MRDEWDVKKPETEERISKALGEAWTVVVNPNLVYVYTDDESYKSRIGSVISWYGLPAPLHIPVLSIPARML